MSYENHPRTVTSSIRLNDPTAPNRMRTSGLEMGTFLYSQRNSLGDSLLLVSRSLMRMRIQHAVMGAGALALKDNASQSPGERGHEIELLMSPEHYAKFRSSWVNQRLAAIAADEHQFWDNRTGYLLRIYVTGDWITIGKRALHLPDVSTLPKTEDGIAYWIPESTETSRSPVEERHPWEKITVQSAIAA